MSLTETIVQIASQIALALCILFVFGFILTFAASEMWAVFKMVFSKRRK